MAAITFGGMASGLPPNIVEKLMEAERIPVQTLERRKGKDENKLNLVTELETKLNSITDKIGTLASSRGFNDVKLISGDPNIVNGVVDPGNSTPGSWNVEVVELPQRAAAVTNGFPDKDRTEIGVGYFRFETPDGDKDVYIDGDSNTLEGAAKAINRAGVGVRATVLNDRKDPDEPFKLMISGETVGGDSRVEYPTLYFLDGDQDLYFDENREAKNGIVKIDGFEFEVSDNKVEDVIPGVTLELRQAAKGRSVSVTVKEDQEVVTGKIKEFVDAVNGVLSFIQTQNRMDENTDTSQTLGGDSLLRSVENRLRRLFQGSQMGVGKIQRLNQLGIQFNRNGTLEYKEELFQKTLASSPQDVQMFFAGDGFTTGFVPTLRRNMRTLLDTAFGPISNRKKSLQQKIRRTDQRIESKERQLVKKEAALRRKFAKLEETMSRLKSQGGALAGLGAGGGGIGGLSVSS